MTYEYICEACGHQWEAQQSISADPLKDCPKCGEAKAKRQISLGAGFILKGGGWYSVLYSSTGGSKGSSGSGGGSGSGSGSGGDTASSTSSDSKSDTASSGSTSAGASSTPAASGGGTSSDAK